MDGPQPEYMTLGEVADLLRMSPSTVRGMLVRGELCRFVRIGRAIRVRRELLEEWLESRERDSGSTGMKWKV